MNPERKRERGREREGERGREGESNELSLTTKEETLIV